MLTVLPTKTMVTLTEDALPNTDFTYSITHFTGCPIAQSGTWDAARRKTQSVLGKGKREQLKMDLLKLRIVITHDLPLKKLFPLFVKSHTRILGEIY